MKLCAVVRRDCLEAELMLLDQLDDPSVGFFFGSVPEFSDQYIASLALNQRDDAMQVATAHDSVDFPVALDAS